VACSALTTPCLEWQGAKKNRAAYRAYGQIWREGKNWTVHRWVWRLAYGEIPEGMHVLHRCDNPPCFRLSHLFLGTMRDNMRDKTAKGRHHSQRKTVCKNGHPLSGSNLYVCPRGRRECRTCRSEATARSQARKKGA